MSRQTVDDIMLKTNAENNGGTRSCWMGERVRQNVGCIGKWILYSNNGIPPECIRVKNIGQRVYVPWFIVKLHDLEAIYYNSIRGTEGRNKHGTFHNTMWENIGDCSRIATCLTHTRPHTHRAFLNLLYYIDRWQKWSIIHLFWLISFFLFRMLAR